jgi:hypothetical protein
LKSISLKGYRPGSLKEQYLFALFLIVQTFELVLYFRRILILHPWLGQRGRSQCALANGDVIAAEGGVVRHGSRRAEDLLAGLVKAQ